jgi:NCS1 family nucleobase:cation symporter-1
MVIIILAKFIILGIALSHGWGGAVWHVGYPIYGRFTFGMYGSFLALIQRIVLCIVWYSVQAYTGGQLVSIMLSCIFSGFNNLHNTLPESLPMTLKQFVGYIIFNVLSIPFLYIPPEKLHHPFKVVTVIAFFAVFGTSIGSMVHAHGAGDLLKSKSTIEGSAAMGMAWMHGINIVINTYAVGLANQPDFSRFASKPGKQVWGQVISILVFGTVVPLFGVLGTSAASQSYGNVNTLNLWNPPNIIEQWLLESYDAKSRCAAFFASFGFFISTLGLNTIDNGVSGGIDLVAIAPRWINIRRGAYIIMIISIVIQPWQILANSGVFLSVLGSYGCFLGPMIGVFTADYYIVRKQKLKLSDLYRGNSDSIYWFWHGINWRGITAWVCGFVPGIVGFPSVNPALTGVPEGAIKIFYISFIVGYPIAFLVHVVLNYFWPPPGVGVIDEYDIYKTFTKEEALKLGVTPNEALDYESDSKTSAEQVNVEATSLKHRLFNRFR